jgi:hypothetical protein
MAAVTFSTNGLTEAEQIEKFNQQLSADLAYFIQDNEGNYKRIFNYSELKTSTTLLPFYYLPISDNCFAILNE